MKGRKARVDVKTFMYDLDARFLRNAWGPPGNPKSHVPKILADLKSKNLDTLGEFISSVKEKLPLEFESHKHEFDLSNPEFVDHLFDLVTTLDVENKATDKAIVKAFQAAGLNHKNPIDWRILLEVFGWAHFGEKGKPGKLIDWTDEKYCKLLRDVQQIKKEYAISKDAPALKKLLDVKRHVYPLSPVRLKKALAEARNVHYNGKLTKVVYEAATADVDARMKANKPLLSKQERETLLKRLSRLEADRIGSSPAPEKS